jgi:hypothetical protein
MSAVRRRRPYGQVGVECRLIPGSTVAKLPVGLACHLTGVANLPVY